MRQRHPIRFLQFSSDLLEHRCVLIEADIKRALCTACSRSMEPRLCVGCDVTSFARATLDGWIKR
jgi:hypothetical protein